MLLEPFRTPAAGPACGRWNPTMKKLKPEPGTYALVLESPAQATVQVGRLGVIRLRPGW
jgi:hypothetical protein